MQLIDDRGFADAGIAGDQHQLRRAALDDAIKGGKQGLDLARPSVQLLGDQQPVRCIVLAQREFLDAAPRFPFGKAAPKVTFSASRSLVAFLRRFGQQLHDDGRDSSRHMLRPLGGRHRLPCNVAVHPFHRIARREGKAAGQQLVKGHTE